MTTLTVNAKASGTFALGGDLTVNRLGYGAMRITGNGIWGEPKDREGAKKVLRRAVELGVNFIDTADSYGPDVSEQLIGEALAAAAFVAFLSVVLPARKLRRLDVAAILAGRS